MMTKRLLGSLGGGGTYVPRYQSVIRSLSFILLYFLTSSTRLNMFLVRADHIVVFDAVVGLSVLLR